MKGELVRQRTQERQRLKIPEPLYEAEAAAGVTQSLFWEGSTCAPKRQRLKIPEPLRQELLQLSNWASPMKGDLVPQKTLERQRLKLPEPLYKAGAAAGVNQSLFWEGSTCAPKDPGEAEAQDTWAAEAGAAAVVEPSLTYVGRTCASKDLREEEAQDTWAAAWGRSCCRCHPEPLLRREHLCPKRPRRGRCLRYLSRWGRSCCSCRTKPHLSRENLCLKRPRRGRGSRYLSRCMRQELLQVSPRASYEKGAPVLQKTQERQRLKTP